MESNIKETIEIHKAENRVNPNLLAYLRGKAKLTDIGRIATIGVRKFGIINKLSTSIPYMDKALPLIRDWIREHSNIQITLQIYCNELFSGRVGRIDFQMLSDGVWFIHELFVGREPDHIPYSILTKADTEYYINSSHNLRSRGIGSTILDMFEDLAEVCGVRQINAYMQFGPQSWRFTNLEGWFGLSFDSYMREVLGIEADPLLYDIDVYLAYPEAIRSLPFSDFLIIELQRILLEENLAEFDRRDIRDDLKRIRFFTSNGYSIYGLKARPTPNGWIPHWLLITKDF